MIMEADCRVCDDDKKPTECQAISAHEEERKPRGEINGASNTRGFFILTSIRSRLLQSLAYGAAFSVMATKTSQRLASELSSLHKQINE